MYLSRVEIDRNNRQKMKKMTHVGAYHNWVEMCFPEEFNAHERTRKLWRIDSLCGKDYLLIVSATPPNLEKLEFYGVSGTGETKDYSSFLSELHEGSIYRFRVTLNPVISQFVANDKRGRVMPHITEAQQMEFLENRSEKNGFTLLDNQYQIVERAFIPFKRHGSKPINLSKVTYEGLLSISDKEKFIETLTCGFGKKKAYGFGLMTVIPV